jgi:hypothetical protein
MDSTNVFRLLRNLIGVFSLKCFHSIFSIGGDFSSGVSSTEFIVAESTNKNERKYNTAHSAIFFYCNNFEMSYLASLNVIYSKQLINEF